MAGRLWFLLPLVRAVQRKEAVIHYSVDRPRNLSERSQTQKTTYFVVTPYEMSSTGTFIDTESRSVVVRGWGRGKRSDCPWGWGLSLG